MKKNSVVWLVALAIVAGLALLIFMRPSAEDAPNKLGTQEKVTVGYSRLRISLPVFVAEQQGFFEKQGVNVELQMYETAQPLMQALVQGNIDVAGFTALPITYNGMNRSGKKLYFLSAMLEDSSHRVSYLLRKPGDTSITSISDLRGKRVGILPTIAYKAWLEAMLREEGLEPGTDVQIQQIAPTLQAQALSSGGVDALFTNDPAATSAIRAEVAELVSDAVEVPNYLGDPFVFGSFNISKEWADANPAQAQAIARALNDAIDFINENPGAAKEMMKPYLPNQFAGDVSAYPNARYTKVGEATQEMLDAAATQYLEIGIVDKEVDLEGAIFNLEN